MPKIFFMFFLFYSNSTFAENLSGCLSKGGAGRLLIDKNCECLKDKTCATFKPKKMRKDLYDLKDFNKTAVFTSLEKNKLQESYDVFYKIMELKASGKGKSSEIKSLYIKLDKLNLDVRKSLLKNHSSDYAVFKKSYQKDQGDRKKRNENMLEKIGILIKNDSQFWRNGAVPKMKPLTEVGSANAVVTASPSASSTTSLSPSTKEDTQFILENSKNKKYQRNNEDSLFEIITKSYQRSAYPLLLAP